MQGDPLGSVSVSRPSTQETSKPILFEKRVISFEAKPKAKEDKTSLSLLAKILSLGILPLIKLIVDKVAPLAVLPGVPLSYKKVFRGIRNDFLKNNPETASVLQMKTSDGVDLDGLLIFQKNEQKIKKDQKWIIMLQGNGQCYENCLQEAKEIGRKSGANVLLFNYRGVLESKGQLERLQDLIIDAETPVEMLREAGINDEDIAYLGHSLGGGIATQVVGKDGNDKIGLVVSRSFGSLAETASSLLPVIGRPIGFLMKSFGWELNSEEQWKKFIKNKKDNIGIITHSQDQLVTKTISLWQKLKKDISVQDLETLKTKRVKLRKLIQRKVGQIIDPTRPLYENILVKSYISRVGSEKLVVYEIEMRDFLKSLTEEEQHQLGSEDRAFIERMREAYPEIGRDERKELKSSIKEKLDTLVKNQLDILKNYLSEMKQLREIKLKLSRSDVNEEVIPQEIAFLERILNDADELLKRPPPKVNKENLKKKVEEGFFENPHNYSYDYDREHFLEITNLCKKVLTQAFSN